MSQAHQLGHDGQTRFFFGEQQKLDAPVMQALEGVRGGARLKGPHPAAAPRRFV